MIAKRQCISIDKATKERHLHDSHAPAALATGVARLHSGREDDLPIRDLNFGTTRTQSTGPPMRSTRDRIRHAISFELIALFIVTPLGALAFSKPLFDIGVIAIGGATIATGWNYLYNLGFDHLMQHMTGSTRKTPAIRVIHAVLFELGLLIALLPFVAWYMDISLWEALVMDVAFALFYVVYAFTFNWAYDRIFPLPEWRQSDGGEPALHDSIE